MKKENVKYTAILLSFAVAVSLVAVLVKKIDEADKVVITSTTKTNSATDETEIETETFYIDENGKYFYNGYELVTDEKGITLADKNGNMIQKVTDAQGNEVTQAVSFPKFISDGNQIICQQFSITLPEGWFDASSYNLKIENENDDKYIDYSFTDKANENYISADESIEQLEDVFKPMVEEGSIAFSKSKIKVAGRDAAKFVIEMYGEYPSYMEIYYIETENGIMTFNCSGNPEDKNFDFISILDTINYRVN